MNSEIRFLVVAATAMEVAPLLNEPTAVEGIVLPSTYKNCMVMISGIGIANTIFNLTKVLTSHSFNVVMNVGICGSYKHSFPPGTVANVVEDRFWDQRVEMGNGAMSWIDAKLSTTQVFSPTWLNHPRFSTLPKARAITSDTVHANPDSIEKIVSNCNPDLESMEGAAVAYVCHKLSVPYCQLRAISNPVGIRDKSQWQIPRALENIHKVIEEIVG